MIWSKVVEAYMKMIVVLLRSTPRPVVVSLLSCAVVVETINVTNA